MADDSSKALLQELVFVELMQEVEYGAPGARLSARLRAALERAGGCAPLFVAARRGNAELVEYLVQVCGAPLEQRGEYSAPAERVAHHVTPLWAAAVAGRLAALRVLADAGADLDARSDSGSTPLRSACFMTHLDVVRFLCSRGADVRARNHNGGTCLINSVQCARLTRYLIAQGAEVDARDAHGKTALHYAIQEHQMKTVRVLLEAGASPLVVSACGDDALQTACVRGAAPAADLLLATGLYSHERCADALDLLGATHLDEFNDVGAALAAWRRSTSIRYSGAQHVRKRGVAPPCAALGGAREWQTPEELEAAAGDAETLRAHATLVAVRVLGERHRNTMFRLMYRGAWYADAGRPQRCAALWTWALRTRIQADTLLHTDTYHTLCALTRLLVDMCFLSGALDEDLQQEQGERAERSEPPSHEDVMCVLRLVARALPESQRLVSVRPWCASQAECWDRALRCLVHLAVLAAATAPGGAPAAASGELRHGTDLVDELAALARLSPATHAGGESLLHLACSRLTTVRSAYFPTEARPRALFPSVRGARLLVACGARAAARDAAGRTPLHVAAAPYNYSAPLVEALRRGGAHACTPDARGTTALELLPPAARRELAAGVTLACLAARALPSRVVPFALPRTLLPFLELHRVPHPASASAPAAAHHDTSHRFMTNV